MTDIKKTREWEIFEYIIGVQMACILIFFISFSLGKSFSSILNLYFALITGTIGVVAAFLYKFLERLLNQKKILYIKIAYVIFPILVTAFVLLQFPHDPYSKQVAILLPVIVAATVLGKNGGLFIAFLGSAFLTLSSMLFYHEPVIKAFEQNLILISVMFLMGWFIGSITNLEAESRKRLQENLDELQGEIERRKFAEEQTFKLSRIVEQSPAIIVLTDTDGNIEFVNPQFTRVTGYASEDITGLNISRLGSEPAEFYEQIYEEVREGKEWSGELLIKKKNSDSFWEHTYFTAFKNADGMTTNFLKISEDITEKKGLQLEMARLDRLNLVGEMAAAIGHEVRNPMTTVRGFLQLLGKKELYSADKEYFTLMMNELDRANSIITEFLSLAKNKAIEKKMNNLNSIISSIAPLLQADATKSDYNVVFELAEIPDMSLDEKEIKQIIFNLVRNGMEAMEHRGTITIKTYQDAGEVVLAVQDQGKGIPDDILPKIGTPFYTTKETGTGLGLAVCYSIAERHNSRIEFKTSPDGTQFFVRFKDSCEAD
ncbi:Sporulation kinase E [Pelotomaculum schinkii]|uniref:histidine kinase n=1 Tax=Pelotomaculum schinkii TaxID=78350 RepID=A0A4Y7RAW4_9FIRM|nr:ATP-binding protein [Pelotomaculum schinkii]TEB05879.1 Sporulation kinase E [Pelotomaculum schinkii]